ncbi:MAG TPA: sigma-70 family RNA polymerase sigma factor [Gemmataceae bacterium]|nr:sigma-70 family RNA polymerase sigma factor [Gemmataceae bacterium]
MDSTPVSLLERLRQTGDDAAWARFVRLYTPLLFHWLRRTSISEDDAADLVQEVLLVLVKRLAEFQYDRSQSFHRWLYAVTLNLWRDRVKRKPLVQLAEARAKLDVPVPDDLDSFIEREYRDRLAHHAWSILKTDFEPQTVRVFQALVLEGRPAAEVAKNYGVSLGAVYAAKCRVLARLRQELAGLWTG